MEKRKVKPPYLTLTPEEAQRLNIPPIIIKKPTESELQAHADKINKISDRVNSLLPGSQDQINIETARRAEIIWSNELNFLLDHWEEITVEDREKRFLSAVEQLAGARLRLGKFDEAYEAAWEGLKLGANTIEFLQRASQLMEAMNRPDDQWCRCGDEIIEDDSAPKVFGGATREVDVLPSLQMLGKVPSYKHGGELTPIVRCNVCGMLNIVPEDKLSVVVLDIEGQSHQQLRRSIKNDSLL